MPSGSACRVFNRPLDLAATADEIDGQLYLLQERSRNVTRLWDLNEGNNQHFRDGVILESFAEPVGRAAIIVLFTD